MHIHRIEDEQGQLVDIKPFCSDACHRDWCETHSIKYEGWDGCHEGREDGDWCANCGVVLPGDDNYACDHQRDNVVVNRFVSTEGEKCEHGNWIQLPASYLGRL